MKYRLIAVLSTSLLILPTNSKALDITRLVSSLCDYAIHNNRSSMRKKIKQERLRLRDIYTSVKCKGSDGFGGGSLLRASTFFGSFDSAKFVTSQIGKKGVSGAEKDGKTILAWTEELLSSGKGNPESLPQFIELYKSKVN